MLTKTFFHCPLWQWLILTISIIILSWISLVHFSAPDIETFISLKTPDIIPLETILSTANNGDLIFLAGTTFTERSIRRWHCSYVNHCALVFRDIDEDTGLDTPFLFESDVGQHYRDGPRVIRLKDKLEKWKGLRYGILKRYITPDDRPSTKNILNIAQNIILRQGTGMDKNMMSWFFSDYPNSRFYKFFKPENTLFCSELVAKVLQTLGILAKDRHESNYTPEDFIKGNITLNKGVHGVNIYFKIS